MKFIFIIVFVFYIYLTLSYGSNRWPNHDISTLRLLQIVHRHGERSPTSFAPNDPYHKSSYWSAGIGELTLKGKYRMYKLGEFIRNEYNDYLGNEYSPREVYVRSALSDRCIESTSCLLSGAYPPKQPVWEWNNGTDAQLGKVWQPFPIETFMPHSDDLVCNQDKHCPAVTRETAQIWNREVFKQFLAKYSDLYRNLSQVVGRNIRNTREASDLHDSLMIEINQNYYWNHTWTPDKEQTIVDQLALATRINYKYEWDSPLIKRLRGGGLVKELNNNFKKVIDNQNKKKIYVYSTHDSTIGALMNALGIFNDNFPPFGSTLLFELHENRNPELNDNYFVRVFYQNETTIDVGIPHSLDWTECQNRKDCPIDQYFNFTQKLIYKDFDKECE